MFDWNDLKHFLAVARQGSTLSAAKKLGVSQSTVHRRLEEFEKQLGRQLMIRHSTGYKMTETGLDMVAYAERVEEAVLDFERRLAASDLELAGTVRLTCPLAIGSRLTRSSLAAKFNQQYPNLRLEFVINDALLDLAKREADVAIRAHASDDERLFGRVIAVSQWAVYASPAYAERHGAVRSIGDINDHAVALFDAEVKDHVARGWLERAAPKARVVARCSSMGALVSAAKSGVCLVALPTLVGDEESALISVLRPLSGLTTNIYLFIHKDMQRAPRVRAVFDFIIENLSLVRQALSEDGSAPKRSKL
ncbi:MAG TPA: LysR family transcriptional regulator [Candidatus Binataceae bacterium]|nr:LysR family transcriptional regulator [Candidatus Binataceae bacterium]